MLVPGLDAGGELEEGIADPSMLRQGGRIETVTGQLHEPIGRERSDQPVGRVIAAEIHDGDHGGRDYPTVVRGGRCTKIGHAAASGAGLWVATVVLMCGTPIAG